MLASTLSCAPLASLLTLNQRRLMLTGVLGLLRTSAWERARSCPILVTPWISLSGLGNQDFAGTEWSGLLFPPRGFFQGWSCLFGLLQCIWPVTTGAFYNREWIRGLDRKFREGVIGSPAGG